MASKQSTLGKFFGNGGASKPTPQQAKLKFKSTASAETKHEVTEDDETPLKTTPQGNGNGDVKMEDADGGNAEPSSESRQNQDEPVSSPSTKQSPATIGKRQAGVKEEDDDDEPPVKKRRIRSAMKAPKGELVSEEESNGAASETKTTPERKREGDRRETKDAKRSSTKSSKVKFDKPKGEDDTLPKAKSKEQTKSKSKKAKRVVEDKEEVIAESSTAKANGKTDDEEVDEEMDEVDDRPSEGEEEMAPEEKEEVSVKAHEKIQSTLKSKSKDPYPDWKPGAPVPFAALCTTFSKIELTTKRLEISAYCSQFLRQVLRLTPNDLLPVVQLMVNKLAADYTGIELGIGESLIMKAIGETTGRNLNIIKADQNEIGDLGLVAAKSRSVQPTMFKPKPLTVRSVHEGLMGIATTEGQGAQGRKIAGIKKLLSAADTELAGSKRIDITHNKGGPSECKYIIRMLEGKMRLGLAEKTVLVAISSAMVNHDVSKNSDKVPSTEQLTKGEQILKSVFNELPSYEVILPALLENGIFKLRDTCKLQAGVPLKPMLARPTKSISEVLDRFEGHEFTCEYKYDGERAQIHFVSHNANEKYATAAPSSGKTEKGLCNIFSRNSEDLSKKYPDILERLPSWIQEGTTSFVIDCETVAWDTKEKKVLPFQQLMTRKRKDVKTEDVKVKVCVFAFDILFLNGEALVNVPFRERREKLHQALKPMEGELAFAQYGNTNVIDEIQVLLEDSVKASCEGLMVKMLDGQSSWYEPSRRSQNWLKVKKDYLAGVGDSLDLVVLGAYYGRGKRTSVYGAFLLAAYDGDNEVFETVCNIGTGFSEAILDELHKQLEPIIIDKPKPFYSHSSGNKDQPDVWFEAKYVWEVKSADLTLSPRYQAAMDIIGQGKGVSLRFPRFLKVREDKKPEEATETKRVAEMYRQQEGVAKNKGPAVDDDFEY